MRCGFSLILRIPKVVEVYDDGDMTIFSGNKKASGLIPQGLSSAV
jgi:hypothetical protein